MQNEVVNRFWFYLIYSLNWILLYVEVARQLSCQMLIMLVLRTRLRLDLFLKENKMIITVKFLSHILFNVVAFTLNSDFYLSSLGISRLSHQSLRKFFASWTCSIKRVIPTINIWHWQLVTYWLSNRLTRVLDSMNEFWCNIGFRSWIVFLWSLSLITMWMSGEIVVSLHYIVIFFWDRGFFRTTDN